jgi:hypothetical protein
MKKEKLYSPEETGTFQMMFGMKNINTSGKKRYEKKKNYFYEDKRTKKYGNQRVELLKDNKL